MRDNNYIINSFNLISVVIIIVLFYFVITIYLQNEIYNVENFAMNDKGVSYDNPFKYQASNTRIMYNNTGTLPWNRHMINSSIPYDVNIKKEAVNVYYYEFDNETFNNKLKEIFKNNCEEIIIAVEGNEWDNWKNPKKDRDEFVIDKLVRYYNKIYDFLYQKLNMNPIMNLPSQDKQQNLQIVHDLMLRYRIHSKYTDYYMFDIDLILYRAGKFQGKHVKVVAITNGIDINIILVKIIGVISEDNIVLHPYKGLDNMNNFDFGQYVPMKYGTVESNDKNSRENSFDINDKYMNSEIENIMYRKLLTENIPEDVDISNNNYIPKKEELTKHGKCLF
jgi:hypothetical protein